MKRKRSAVLSGQRQRRQALTRSDLTDAERKTVMALSQPGLAFWAGRGYQTFHRRNCPKITGLTRLRGFPRYQDAVRAENTPCRHCKPSPKQDVVFSIPITNQEHTGETTDTLIQLCTAHGLPFEYDGRYFTLQTMAGKWRIDTNMKPVHLEHINLVSGFGDPQKYHIQPRLFIKRYVRLYHAARRQTDRSAGSPGFLRRGHLFLSRS